jgi:hypothetical protein
MAYISFQPNDYFNNILYTGTGSEPRALTGFGHQPDWIWVKRRDDTGHHTVIDAVRGGDKIIYPNLTNGEDTATAAITFGTDGMTWNGGNYDINDNGETMVLWSWKGGTTSGITTNGSTVITPSAYSFSATSGFSAVKYTGNGNTTTKVAHGLGAAPKWILIKKTNSSEDWSVYHVGAGNDTSLTLNSNGGTTGGSNRFYDTTPDSVNFTLGDSGLVNGSGDTYIAYCFAEKSGFSSFGKYIGNASTNGPFIHCGFKPAWFMIKRIGSGYSWAMKDNKVNPNNPVSVEMYANDSSGDTAGSAIDFLSNGVKIRSNSGTYNHSGISYAYMAFAEEPFVASNGDPATAR